MNALAHCVEVAWSPSRTAEAEAVALAGAGRLVEALPWVVDDPSDLGARTEAFAGALLAGRALPNATMGVHHGLSQLVGGRTGIAHGLANAIILPHAMAYNADAVPEALAAIGLAIGAPDDPIGAVSALVHRLGLPARLSECGVTDEDLDAVARLASGNRNVAANPKPVSEADARAILAAAS
jgi:maleylacetate reductase